MKNTFKIIIKICLFTYLLTLTPFFDVLPTYMQFDLLNFTSSIYAADFMDDTTSMKEQLNLMQIHENVLLSSSSDEEIRITNDQVVSGITEQKKDNNVKKVYIYNTHQQEAYLDKNTVIDASVVLANALQEAGVQVVYEDNDFKTWLYQNGLDYNSSYAASSYYLKAAIKKHGEFDLIIDFHRDAVPRESAYIKVNDKNYAKLMCVVGGLSKNVSTITNTSQKLTSIVNAEVNGMMKRVMVREAYYNQDLSNKMVLIEVGSDTNYYEEVNNSTKILAKAILQYLQG